MLAHRRFVTAFLNGCASYYQRILRGLDGLMVYNARAQFPWIFLKKYQPIFKASS
jgi:hypothetical protein